MRATRRYAFTRQRLNASSARPGLTSTRSTPCVVTISTGGGSIMLARNSTATSRGDTCRAYTYRPPFKGTTPTSSTVSRRSIPSPYPTAFTLAVRSAACIPVARFTPPSG